ncbi:MAG: hypothetical protein EBY79_06450 [Actinobacteria bacterium]|nr:hypothetical protein [Actinomycetota bacterium]
MSDTAPLTDLAREAMVIRLTNELRLANERLAALELEVLNSRDHAIGRATEIGELRHRLLAQAAMYERRLSEARQTHATHDVNHRAHIARLEEALVTANAATRDAQRSVANINAELARTKASFTWKLGRTMMWPVRVLKRLVRRA